MADHSTTDSPTGSAPASARAPFVDEVSALLGVVVFSGLFAITLLFMHFAPGRPCEPGDTAAGCLAPAGRDFPWVAFGAFLFVFVAGFVRAFFIGRTVRLRRKSGPQE